MTISFSITGITSKNKYRQQGTQKILEKCDLIFVASDQPYKDVQAAEELFPNKLVKLSYCTNSERILNGIRDLSRSYLFAGREKEKQEIETIYYSLPRGVTLFYHTYVTILQNDKPIEIIIPHAN